MEPVDRTDHNLLGLVSDLDAKLDRAKASHPAAVDVDPARLRTYTLGQPTWVLFLAVASLVLALALVAVRPWQERCTYSAELCRVEQLDIDALRITIPDSELLATLPNIDALDPNDELTAGEIFAMERFEDLDVEALLTREEIDLLLQYLE